MKKGNDMEEHKSDLDGCLGIFNGLLYSAALWTVIIAAGIIVVEIVKMLK